MLGNVVVLLQAERGSLRETGIRKTTTSSLWECFYVIIETGKGIYGSAIFFFIIYYLINYDNNS